MKKFKSITSTYLPIREENIDTDQIVPARFLRLTTRKGFGKYLFYDWRFDNSRKPKNNPYFHGSIGESNKKILLAGNNFGCGSSREHAVWAILDYGFQVVISSSFGDIFYNNAFKNGLLLVTLKQSELNLLFKIIEKNPQGEITVDLVLQQVIINKPKNIFTFPMDSFRKTCMLKGVDELGYILSFEKEIKEYEKSQLKYI